MRAFPGTGSRMDKVYLKAGEGDVQKRIDAFLTREMAEYSRSFLQKLLKEGAVTVGGKAVKPNYRLREKDEIAVEVPEPKETDVLPEDIPLDILYEDEALLVVNKPKDMVVHPAAGHASGTLVNALLHHCAGQLSGIGGVLRPGIVHRIDKDTTGALVVCKTDHAHQKMAEQLAVHSITRRYRAIVHGHLKEDEFTIHTTIGRHPTDRKKMAVNAPNGKDAVTDVKVLQTFREFSYIECTLHTGRTHQIRVHLSSIGHPVLGDETYGPKKCPVKGLQGQTLHAYMIGFIHPETGQYMEVSAPLPAYFQKLLEKLSHL